MPTKDREYSDWLDHEVSTRWLRGVSPDDIAAGLGLTTRYVNRILAPHRTLMAAGRYADTLAKLAAEGFTGLPTAETAGGRPGRPPVPLTAVERAIRDAYLRGTRICQLAREHGTYPQQVRAILTKKPSVFIA
jgi:hypothetical protein